jgi:hypothetical protein
MEHETLAMQGKHLRSRVTRMILNMYVKLVELFCAKTIAHTAYDRNEWAPGIPRKYVRIEQPRGSVFFLGAS